MRLRLVTRNHRQERQRETARENPHCTRAHEPSGLVVSVCVSLFIEKFLQLTDCSALLEVGHNFLELGAFHLGEFVPYSNQRMW